MTHPSSSPVIVPASSLMLIVEVPDSPLLFVHEPDQRPDGISVCQIEVEGHRVFLLLRLCKTSTVLLKDSVALSSNSQSGRTFELTRRGKSKHPPPHQARYKTRPALAAL